MKNKISISLDAKIYEMLDKYDNKSKYVEELIIKDLINRNLIKKEDIL
jgi:hypothetical protein